MKIGDHLVIMRGGKVVKGEGHREFEVVSIPYAEVNQKGKARYHLIIDVVE